MNVRSILDAFARRKGYLTSWCLMCHRVIGKPVVVPTERAGISDGIHPGKCVDAYRAKYCGKAVA